TRCFMEFGGDLLLLTQDGLYPLSTALRSERLDEGQALSNKIYSAISAAIGAYSGNFGWEVFYYPKSSMLIVNVPVSTGFQQQYVMNTITKAWCNFTGWAANCWQLFNDEPYFGANGMVGRAWNGFDDNGVNINALAQQAFNSFSSFLAWEGKLRRFVMARPILSTSGSPSAAINLNVDYDTSVPNGSLSFTGNTAAKWDVAQWDNAVWGSGQVISKNWYGVNGIGYTASINLQVASKGIETHWLSTEIVFEVGNIL
ncbi:MAG: hypothetical protein KGI54_19005, partial [Pseudomonadota bacterium]|nr:hypothetical protein [Pseudomonadota bacterium]